MNVPDFGQSTKALTRPSLSSTLSLSAAASTLANGFTEPCYKMDYPTLLLVLIIILVLLGLSRCYLYYVLPKRVEAKQKQAYSTLLEEEEKKSARKTNMQKPRKVASNGSFRKRKISGSDDSVKTDKSTTTSTVTSDNPFAALEERKWAPIASAPAPALALAPVPAPAPAPAPTQQQEQQRPNESSTSSETKPDAAETGSTTTLASPDPEALKKPEEVDITEPVSENKPDAKVSGKKQKKNIEKKREAGKASPKQQLKELVTPAVIDLGTVELSKEREEQEEQEESKELEQPTEQANQPVGTFVTDHTKEIESLRQQLEQKQLAIDEIKSQNQSAIHQKVTIEEQLDSVIEQLDAKSALYVALENKYKNLDSKSESLTYTNSLMFKQLSVERENIKQLTAQLDQERQHHKQPEGPSITDLQSQNEQLQNLIDQQNQDRHNLSIQLLEHQRNETQLSRNIEQLRLEKDNDQQLMNKFLAQKDHDILVLHNNLEQLSHQVNKANDTLVQREQEVHKVKNQHSHTQSQLNEATKRVQDLSESVQRAEASILDHATLLKTTRADKDALSQRVSELGSSAANVESLSSQRASSLEVQLKAVEQELVQTRDAKLAAETSRAQLESELEASRKSAHTLDEQIARVQAELQNKSIAHAELTSKHNVVTSEIGQVQAQLALVREELTTKVAAHAEVHSRAEELAANVKLAEDNAAVAEAELKRMKVVLESKAGLEARIKELESAQQGASTAQEVERIRDEMAAKEAAAAEVTRELVATREQFASIQVEMDALRAELAGKGEANVAELETSRSKMRELEETHAAELETSRSKIRELEETNAAELETSRSKMRELEEENEKLKIELTRVASDPKLEEAPNGDTPGSNGYSVETLFVDL